MAEQTLDNDEQINCRWAYDDPNPRAQAVRLRNDAQTMLAAMEQRGDLDAPLEYPEELDEHSSKRQHVGEEAAPMTREDHEREQEQQRTDEEEHAQQLAAQQAQYELEAQRVAQQAEVRTNESKLDAILQGIDNSADGTGGND